jgi:hypothetical protein
MISAEQLQAVGNWLADNVAGQNREQALRAAFPDMHFTFCLDDDVMSDAPVSELSGFNLYLVDSSNHCLSLTRDLEQATGLVVAELDDD